MIGEKHSGNKIKRTMPSFIQERIDLPFYILLHNR